jgi:hypothetical protein
MTLGRVFPALLLLAIEWAFADEHYNADAP